MTKWWNGLHSLQQVLFVVACAATLFMIVQIILLAIGSGDNDATFDSDASIDDVDTANEGGIGFSVFGLKVLTVRSIIAFLAIGSWLTFALFEAIRFYALIPGIAAGIAAAFAVAAVMKALTKLQCSGNIQTQNTVGKTADVYLTIPASRSGNGKVTVFVQERLAEFDAVTDNPEPIKTGAKVKVTDTLNEGILIVEPFTYTSEEKEKEEN